jgi:hypothetical protein
VVGTTRRAPGSAPPAARRSTGVRSARGPQEADTLNLRADALVHLGGVLEQAGRGDDARAAFLRALELYERKGNIVLAARVRERLADFS